MVQRTFKRRGTPPSGPLDDTGNGALVVVIGCATFGMLLLVLIGSFAAVVLVGLGWLTGT
ncbi:MAG: hypothetical protein ACI9MC_002005 [Kiritimatiellia bacterium]|jgi:hypothetical protein